MLCWRFLLKNTSWCRCSTVNWPRFGAQKFRSSKAAWTGLAKAWVSMLGSSGVKDKDMVSVGIPSGRKGPSGPLSWYLHQNGARDKHHKKQRPFAHSHSRRLF